MTTISRKRFYQTKRIEEREIERTHTVIRLKKTRQDKIVHVTLVKAGDCDCDTTMVPCAYFTLHTYSLPTTLSLPPKEEGGHLLEFVGLLI